MNNKTKKRAPPVSATTVAEMLGAHDLSSASAAAEALEDAAARRLRTLSRDTYPAEEILAADVATADLVYAAATARAAVEQAHYLQRIAEVIDHG